MFDPLTIGTGVVLYQLFKRQAGPAFGAMTPQREEVFNNALEHLKDPRVDSSSPRCMARTRREDEN